MIKHGDGGTAQHIWAWCRSLILFLHLQLFGLLTGILCGHWCRQFNLIQLRSVLQQNPFFPPHFFSVFLLFSWFQQYTTIGIWYASLFSYQINLWLTFILLKKDIYNLICLYSLKIILDIFLIVYFQYLMFAIRLLKQFFNHLSE